MNAGLSHQQFVQAWPQYEKLVLDFLTELEARSTDEGLTRNVLSQLAKQAADIPEIIEEGVIGYTGFRRTDISTPFADLPFPHPVEQVIFTICNGKEKLGMVELPVIDGLVSANVLKDAIAYKLAWKILGCFFHATATTELTTIAAENNYPDPGDFETLHDQFGWYLFLKQIWPEEKRQAAGPDRKTNRSFRQNKATKAITIEIGNELPAIKTKEPLCDITFTAGGVVFGRLLLKTHNDTISPDALRSAIEAEYGYEFCKVCVREALLGQSLKISPGMKQRLQAKTTLYPAKNLFLRDSLRRLLFGKRTNGQTTVAQLERRQGYPGTSISRRAALPLSSLSSLLTMAAVTGEKWRLPGKQWQGVLYLPELATHPDRPLEDSAVSFGHNVQAQHAYDRHHFETLFSKAADPWKYTHPYEQVKYEQTLSLLPSSPVNRCLELACAEGHFTVQLAPHVRQLVAADISEVALERAAERCRDFSHITYRQVDISQGDIPGKYDLVVCSEVLYYMGGIDALKTVAQKMSNALLPGGYLLMAHAHQVIDEPEKPGFDWGLEYGAKRIGEVFNDLPELTLVNEIRTPLYRIQLFQQKAADEPGQKPMIRLLEQPAPVPPEVESSVRWQGGQSSIYSEIIETRRLPVLMYHRVAPSGAANMRRYRVSPEQFEEQLRYLRDSGYYSIGINDWLQAMLRRRPLPGRAIALTFDDGYHDFYAYAFPLLKQYGFTATVFLVSDFVGKANSWDTAFGEEVPLLDIAEIRHLQQEGILFGSHTATHTSLTALSPGEIVEEAARSRTTLSELLGVAVNTIAYPYGYTNEAVAHLCGGVGYVAGLSCQPGLSKLQDNPLLLPRIEVTGHDELKDFVVKLAG